MNTSETTPGDNKSNKNADASKPETRNPKLETENMEPENGLHLSD
jgi:hypothetical protein